MILKKPANIQPILKGPHELVDIDLTTENPNLQPTNPGPYIYKACDNFQKTGIGGYLEKRKMYEVSDLFKGQAYRNIHLGIDLWQSVDTPVHIPVDGKIHSFQDNDQAGDYGPTIITEHRFEDTVFYLLFGHLTRESLDNISIGQSFEAGEQITSIGSENENGGWPPHLHFQVILDLQGHTGDYPGVAFEKDLPFYQQNCPDPRELIVFD